MAKVWKTSIVSANMAVAVWTFESGGAHFPWDCEMVVPTWGGIQSLRCGRVGWVRIFDPKIRQLGNLWGYRMMICMPLPIGSIGIYWLYQFDDFWSQGPVVQTAKLMTLMSWKLGSTNQSWIPCHPFVDVRWVESCILKIEVHEDPRLHRGQGQSLKETCV